MSPPDLFMMMIFAQARLRIGGHSSKGKKCPHCGNEEWEIISGKEFMIKEIIAC